jgi:hypothetical protein
VQFNLSGTYYYRCEVHPSVMRGVVQVNFVAGAVGGKIDLPVTGDSAESAAVDDGGAAIAWMTFAVAAGAAVVVLGGVGVLARARLRRPRD